MTGGSFKTELESNSRTWQSLIIINQQVLGMGRVLIESYDQMKV